MSSSGTEKGEKGEKWYPGKFLKERRKSSSTKDDDQMDSSSSSAHGQGETNQRSTPTPSPTTPSGAAPVALPSNPAPLPPASSPPIAPNTRAETRPIQRDSSIDSVKSKFSEDVPKQKERRGTSSSSKDSAWYPGTHRHLPPRLTRRRESIRSQTTLLGCPLSLIKLSFTARFNAHRRLCPRAGRGQCDHQGPGRQIHVSHTSQLRGEPPPLYSLDHPLSRCLLL
jgi:hypothetical protein